MGRGRKGVLSQRKTIKHAKSNKGGYLFLGDDGIPVKKNTISLPYNHVEKLKQMDPKEVLNILLKET